MELFILLSGQRFLQPPVHFTLWTIAFSLKHVNISNKYIPILPKQIEVVVVFSILHTLYAIKDLRDDSLSLFPF